MVVCLLERQSSTTSAVAATSSLSPSDGALPDLERLKPHNTQQSQPTRECHWGLARIFAYSNRNAFCFVSTTFPALATLVALVPVPPIVHTVGAMVCPNSSGYTSQNIQLKRGV